MSLNQSGTWRSEEWDFEYEIPEFDTSGTSEISPPGSREDPFNNLVAFGSSLFEGIFKFFGGVFDGVVDFVGGVFGPVLEAVGGAVIAIVGGLANILGNVANFFRPGSSGPPKPIPEVLNPFNTAILETLQPVFDELEQNQQELERLSGEAETLNGQLGDVIKDIDPESTNGKAWGLQQDINNLRTAWEKKAEDDFKLLSDTVQELAQTQLLMFSGKANSNVLTADHWKWSQVNGTWVLEAKGDWVGAADITFYGDRLLQASDSGSLWWETSSGYYSALPISQTKHHSVSIPDAGNRKWTAPFPRLTQGSNVYTEGTSVSVVYQLDPGTPGSDTKSVSNRDENTQGSWRTIPEFNFTTPERAEFSYFLKIGWDAANRGSEYGIRIFNRTQNKVIAFDGPRTDIGPSTVFGNGHVYQILQGIAMNKHVKAGDKIEFQIWLRNANKPEQRRVRDGERKVFWVNNAK